MTLLTPKHIDIKNIWTLPAYVKYRQNNFMTVVNQSQEEGEEGGRVWTEVNHPFFLWYQASNFHLADLFP